LQKLQVAVMIFTRQFRLFNLPHLIGIKQMGTNYLTTKLDYRLQVNGVITTFAFGRRGASSYWTPPGRKRSKGRWL